MKLKNTYIVGVHVMFYEIEMLEEYLRSCKGMIEQVDNLENIMFHFAWNITEHFEGVATRPNDLTNRAFNLINSYLPEACITIECYGYPEFHNDHVYNIADYRRELNDKYCMDYDFILWGETDSLWPRETLHIIEQVDDYAQSTHVNKYILSFAERKMWDESWKIIEHPDYTDVEYQDTDDWVLNNPASSKSYMTLEEMYAINNKTSELSIAILSEPKFDGSCLVIKSDLIKSGVNIPRALLCSGEDTSFGDMAKLILGDHFIQYVVKNILRVHNRRHPQKRMYIVDENNPYGFCGNAKGNWWPILEGMSKENLMTLRYQAPIHTMDDVLKRIAK